MSPQQILEVLGARVSVEVTEIVYQNLAEANDPEEVTELLDSITDKLIRIVKLRLADAYAEGFHAAVYAAKQTYIPYIQEENEDKNG